MSSKLPPDPEELFEILRTRHRILNQELSDIRRKKYPEKLRQARLFLSSIAALSHCAGYCTHDACRVRKEAKRILDETKT